MNNASPSRLCCLLACSALLFSAYTLAQESANTNRPISDVSAEQTEAEQPSEPPPKQLSTNEQSSKQDLLLMENTIRAVVNSEYLEVHTGPGRGYPVFHSLERGEQFYILKSRTDWFKIRTRRGTTGWIKRDDLQWTTDLDGEPLNFSLPSREDYANRRWDMGVMVGDFQGIESLTFNLGYRFNTNMSAELRYEAATGKVSSNSLYLGAINYQPFPGWRLSPFLLIGAGVIETSPNATIVQPEDRSDTVLLSGAGIQYYLQRNFVLRGEYNNHYILTSRNENEEIHEWKLGFSVFF
jgi:uncharacterized protein YgiM (DUF1202 family)